MVRQGRMAAGPCHCLFSFYVQRRQTVLPAPATARSFGVPFNIASYALLLTDAQQVPISTFVRVRHTPLAIATSTAITWTDDIRIRNNSNVNQGAAKG